MTPGEVLLKSKLGISKVLDTSRIELGFGCTVVVVISEGVRGICVAVAIVVGDKAMKLSEIEVIPELDGVGKTELKVSALDITGLLWVIEDVKLTVGNRIVGSGEESGNDDRCIVGKILAVGKRMDSVLKDGEGAVVDGWNVVSATDEIGDTEVTLEGYSGVKVATASVLETEGNMLGKEPSIVLEGIPNDEVL